MLDGSRYDIFPTVLVLAGAPLPDVKLDGIDLSKVRFHGLPLHNRFSPEHRSRIVFDVSTWWTGAVLFGA